MAEKLPSAASSNDKWPHLMKNKCFSHARRLFVQHSLLHTTVLYIEYLIGSYLNCKPKTGVQIKLTVFSEMKIALK